MAQAKRLKLIPSPFIGGSSTYEVTEYTFLAFYTFFDSWNDYLMQEIYKISNRFWNTDYHKEKLLYYVTCLMPSLIRFIRELLIQNCKNCRCTFYVQCIRKVFTVLHFFHILLCYSLIPKWNKFIFFLKILHRTPHNDNMKKVFFKCLHIYIFFKIRNHREHHSLCSILCWCTFGSNYSLKSFWIWCHKLGILVVLNFFHLRMMEATVLIGTFKAAEFFLYPSPDLFLKTILSRRSTDNSFDFMLGFVLWHALSTVGPYIDRCVPFQMSNQLNLPQVDFN